MTHWSPMARYMRSHNQAQSQPHIPGDWKKLLHHGWKNIYKQKSLMTVPPTHDPLNPPGHKSAYISPLVWKLTSSLFMTSLNSLLILCMAILAMAEAGCAPSYCVMLAQLTPASLQRPTFLPFFVSLIDWVMVYGCQGTQQRRREEHGGYVAFLFWYIEHMKGFNTNWYLT